MAKGDSCAPVRDVCDFTETQRGQDYLFDVQIEVGKLLGNPNTPEAYGYSKAKGTRVSPKEAHKAHKRMHKKLVDFLFENGAISNGTIGPEAKVDGIIDYLHAYLGTAREGESLLSSPQSVISAERLLDRLIEQDRNETRDIAPEQAGWWKRIEKAVMPAIYSAMNYDRWGLYNRFVKNAISLTERVRSTRAPYTDRLINAHSAFQNFMEDVVGRRIAQGELSSDWVMGGIVVKTNVKEMGEVLFLGDLPQEPGKNIQSEIILKDGTEGTVDYHVINRNELKLALNAKYRDELGSKIMDGTVRKVQFIDAEKVPVKDVSLKREYGKANTGAEAHGIIGILNELRIKEKLGESSGRVHSKQVGQYIYKYVMIKQGERTGGPEVYNAYIISHQRADKKESPVYYFDIGYNKKIAPKKAAERANLHKASEVFESGWYEASGWGTHGEIISRYSKYDKSTKTRERRSIQYSVDKQPIFSDLNPMEHPPHNSIMSGVARSDPLNVDMRDMNFWDHINEKRSILKDFFDEVVQPQAKRNSVRLRNVMPKFKEVIEALDFQAKIDMAERLDEGRNPKEEYTEAELKQLDAEASKESLKTFLEVYNAEIRVSITKNGLINSSNMYTYPKQENYFPWMWRDFVIMDMLKDAIDSIELRKENTPDLTEEEETEYDEQIETFQSLVESIKIRRKTTTNEIDKGTASKINVGAKSAMLKHRKAWTDVNKVRRDGDVLKEYMNQVQYSLLKEELVVDALETIVEMKELGEQEGSNKRNKAAGVGRNFYRAHVDGIINRLKYALNDPTAEAGLPLPGGKTWNYGFQRMADFLNKEGMEGVKHDAHSVAKVVTFLRGLTTSIFLGAAGALTNRTQSINPFVVHGHRTWMDAMNILSNLDSKANREWKAIIQAVGTDELVQAFNDAVGTSEETDLTDAGFIQIPVPFMGFLPTNNFFRLMRMVRANREDWIKNGGIPELDAYLNKIELRRIKSWRDMKKLLKDKNVPASVRSKIVGVKGRAWYTGGTLKDIEKELIKAQSGKSANLLKKRDLEELREVYLDLLLTPESENTQEILEAKFVNLMGYVTDNRLKMMVSWKLTFWYGDKAKYLTYTEGEKFMRRHGVIMELLAADDRGILGVDDGVDKITIQDKDPITGEATERIVEVQSRFLTPKAKSIARKAVRQMFFGMTKVHMGDALGGGGDVIWQYKGYAIQQMWHDYRLSKTFWSGGANFSDNMGRVKDEIQKMYAESREGRTFDPNDPNADLEARAYARLLMSRHALSILNTIIESLPIMNAFVRKTPSWNIFKGAVRGGENPYLAFTYRMALRTAFLMALSDEDKVLWGLGDGMSGFLRLFLPLWVTYWPQTLYRMAKKPFGFPI